RFPRDAAARYAREADFGDWSHRLRIYGLDLRHTPSVEAFCSHLLGTRDRLDIIVNNACQTVRRPPDFYRHMMASEAGARDALPPGVQDLLGSYEGRRAHAPLATGRSERGIGPGGRTANGAGGRMDDSSDGVRADPAAADRGTATPHPGASAPTDAGVPTTPGLPGLTHAPELSQLPLLPEEREAQPTLFPMGRLDQDRQQIDLRERNSWRMLMADVPTVELLEVQLINAVAPFILNARLKPLMLRTPNRDKHIVN